jgi:hypothetical protein
MFLNLTILFSFIAIIMTVFKEELKHEGLARPHWIRLHKIQSQQHRKTPLL